MKTLMLMYFLYMNRYIILCDQDGKKIHTYTGGTGGEANTQYQ